MKTNSVASTVCVALSVIVSSQAFGQRFSNLSYRCQEDSLDVNQAKGRIAWYARNYPREIQQMAFQEIGRAVTQEQALAWYNQITLGDPIFGGAVIYPTFARTDLSNPAPKYFAPTDPDGPANKPTNYYWVGSCILSS